MEKMTPERAVEIIRGMIRDTYERGEKRGALEMAVESLEEMEIKVNE